MKKQISHLLKSLIKNVLMSSKRVKSVKREVKESVNHIISIIMKREKEQVNLKCQLCRECECQKLNSTHNDESKSAGETDADQSSCYFKDDQTEDEPKINEKMIDISISELIGVEYSDEENPYLSIPQGEVELLEFNKSEKYYKYFNAKLLFQKYTKTSENGQSSMQPQAIKKEFGWIYISNSRLIIRLFLSVKGSNFKIMIRCRNKRFKGIKGFDYFSEIGYNELFFLSIIKYIVFNNKKDCIGLFQHLLNSVNIYAHKTLFNNTNNEWSINPALNLNTPKILNFKQSYMREDALEYITEGLYFSRNVIEIVLEENRIDDKGVLILSKALKSPHCNLKTLGLSYNSIGDDGAKYISEALMINKTIKAIGLYNNCINNMGASCLGEMFKSNSTLESITLSKNTFVYEGLKNLIEGLSQNKKLKVIGLEFLNINDRGAFLIKDLIFKNSFLEGINLSNNSICDDGFSSICDGLNFNKKLSALSIRRNHISDQGAISLSNTILKNFTLTNLYLHENSIRNEGARNLLDSIKLNKTVQQLFLYENNIQHDMKSVIKSEEKRIKI